MVDCWFQEWFLVWTVLFGPLIVVTAPHRADWETEVQAACRAQL